MMKVNKGILYNHAKRKQITRDIQIGMGKY